VASPVRLAANAKGMVCLYRKPATDGPTPAWYLATYATADEDWHEAGPVVGTEGLASLWLTAAGEAFVVAVAEGDRPAVARLEEVARRLEPFTPVAAEGTAGRPSEPYSWVSVAVMGGLAFLVMLLVLRGGRTQAAVLGRAETQAGHPAAPIWRRALAVGVDYLLVLGGAGAIVSAVAPSVNEAMQQVVDQILAGQRVVMDWRPMLLLQAVRLGVILVYFTLAEGLRGRTVGKALLGIEVRSLEGTRAAFWQAAVRNVLRPIDELPMLYLLGLALIVSGPRPQRLGDRAARTLVVRTVDERAG